MSSLTPFKFDKTSLFTVTIDGKVWTRAKEVVQSALEYRKETADVIRAHCSRENYAHKCELSKLPAADTPLKWPIDSRKDDYYINEEGMNELVFTSQQPKVHLHSDTVLLKEAGLYCFLLRCGKPEAEPFMDWVCEEVLPREVRKLLGEIEEKDTQLALLSDDLIESQDLVRQLEFNNTGL